MFQNQQPYGQQPFYQPPNNQPLYNQPSMYNNYNQTYGNTGYSNYGPGGFNSYQGNNNMIGPTYRQIAVGSGIDMSEYNSIVECCKNAFMNGGLNKLSGNSAEAIRKKIGGDWFVFISTVGDENYDFNLTKVKGSDFMVFSLDSTKFQVCRIS